MVKAIIKKDLKEFFPAEFSNRNLIGKFLDYVMNNFFQKSYEKYINGYIGKKTVAVEQGDYYLTEPSAERQTYQLSPMVVTSTDVDNEQTYIDFTNFINILKSQGCDTNDQNRLLSADYWSWCPPINIDMFLNYNFYYWVEKGIPPINLISSTNAIVDIIGQKEYTYNGVDEDDNPVTVDFKSGMRIVLNNDSNSEYNNTPFIVEGVGESIILINDSEILISPDKNPDYLIMERGCKDGNAWSLRNRWFHRSVIDKMDANNLNQFKQAKKPIICFNRDLQLYDHGSYNRGLVDIFAPIKKSDIHGLPPKIIQGVELKDGMTILITNDSDVDTNNMIYQISGISTVGVVVLQPVINGENKNGEPIIGEGITVRRGLYANQYFQYKNNSWVAGQQKTKINQSPLFELYDENKNGLGNALYYPQTTFRGNTIFNYMETTDLSAIIDEDLGIKILTNGYGNYLFENSLRTKTYTYLNYNVIENIDGFRFTKLNGTDSYLNNWFLSTNLTSQYITTELTVTDDKKYEYVEDEQTGFISTFIVYDLAYQPNIVNNLRSSFVYVNGNLLTPTLYKIEDKKLKISNNVTLKNDDSIYIKLLILKLDEKIANGYFYDLPLTITSNAKNEDISTIAYNESFDQFRSIIENQTAFNGNSSGLNNYINTEQNESLGTEILQHSNPTLKTMLLNSKEFTSIRNVISFVKSEYSKFKVKYRNVIETMSNIGEFVDTSDIDTIVKEALSRINIGKEGLSSFYNNGVASEFGETYIPSTPAYLGIDNIYKPMIIQLEEGNKPFVLLNHDGSYTKLFNDFRDSALLRIEEAIYNSVEPNWKDGLPQSSPLSMIPGKFRKLSYSLAEYNNFLSPLFEKWCQQNKVDYSLNDTFDYTDPFTWNWTGTFSKDGEELIGSYRAIYQYYYDTYRPHTHPWEMLGFGSRPSWWVEKYGDLPYTNSNYQMWIDIENGIIADGISKGTYDYLKRPNLFSEYLPVDDNGKLLNPFEIGISTTEPISFYASKPWKVGDIGKIEQLWRFTSDYRYDLQVVLYLMKPIKWVENNWDTQNIEVLFPNTTYEQTIYRNLGRRPEPRDIILHNEIVDGNYIKHIGIQQWISDNLVYENIDISTYIGQLIRNVDMKLSYRCAGYFKQDSLKVLSDNYGIIPTKNYHLDLYKTITDKQYSYSGIIVQKVSNGYLIDGYDFSSPYFTCLKPEINGKKSPIGVNGRNVLYYNEWKEDTVNIKYKTVYGSLQDVYNVIIGYGKYLESQGFDFIKLNSNGEIIDFRTCAYDFLIWASTNPEENIVILLNPGCEGLTITHNGFIDKIGKYLNGYWTITDTAGNPIYNDKIEVYRQDGLTYIEPTEKLMTLVKTSVVEFEHLILFDNKTLFGDIIYDPLLCIKTQRLKLLGIGVEGWNGTLFAPGYLIDTTGAIPNYDKLVEDFKYFYDTDDVRSQGIFGEHAKKTIGFKKFSSMERLLVDDRNIFDFYKGQLKEKGTRRSFNKLNRSTYIMGNQANDIELYENWAFKLGEFGYTDDNYVMEFKINPDLITQDPQIISFTTSETENKFNSIIELNWNNKNWLKRLKNKDDNTFKFSDNNVIYPTGGLVKVSDVDFVVADMNELELKDEEFELGKSIWVIKSVDGTFEVFRKLYDNYQTRKFETIKDMVVFDKEFVEVGELLWVVSDVLIDNMFIKDDENNDVKLIDDPNNLMRKEENIINKHSSAVFKYMGKDKPYELVRCQNKLPNVTDLSKCYLVNDDTNETLTTVQLYDPLQGIFPNNVLDEINYMTAYDPVTDYTDFTQWSENKLGYLWWDISKVRYLEYHQGDIYYRRNNWGKQLPGSEIAIYEWTRSYDIPSGVDNYITKETWNSSTATVDTHYFFWKKNPSDIPNNSFRTKSALQISRVINSPQEEGIVWLAPIYVGTGINKYSSFIICNFDKIITGNPFVVQLNFLIDKDITKHAEWVSLQEDNDAVVPEILWNRMKYSLVGYDNLGQQIPDPNLLEREKLGISIRPRQTMFNNLSIARQNFKDVINDIFNKRDVLSDVDVDKPLFKEQFYAKSPYPEFDYAANTYQDMKELYDNGLIGKTILVYSDETHDNIWTLWSYDSLSSQTLLDYQTFDVSKYWEYKDLYLDELTKFTQPIVTFNTELEFITNWTKYNLKADDVIKYYNEKKNWVLKQYKGNSVFHTIGLQNGTINLLDNIYSFMDDEFLKSDETIFIDDKTKYQYLIDETSLVIQYILSYFES